MKTTILSALCATLAVSACSGTGASYEPALSSKAGPGYQQDLAECRALAKSQSVWNGETRTAAAVGAGVGALAGFADDDVSNEEGLVSGLIVGAATGAAAGALETRHLRKDILIGCLRDRGHPVAG
ncbi:hypothetical protein ACMU_10100 [Actibacterium mucosum KCTC 23349]|uniref:Glycine zipper domain-containing protein n=1 Tax=Actibacterium mucosum KCTC 23349 TaxID=1454373 RepID=A0A037ZI24_9RHOB|nr:hypothetical protein [Actibacterium mucosum]KAJ56100.1 hypothetical protein ACMU_10100 [Actibacterium mucosum KCTC 23349]